jgi:ribosome-interacting GTPase 1
VVPVETGETYALDSLVWYSLSMPANLPPEYFEAEKRYKQASDVRDRISCLESLISTIPKHKGTDKLRADLRRRLSKLREEGTRRRKGGARGDLYTVPRQGAGQVALVGLANCGKSSLLAALTNANPVIADFPLSTVMPLAGMMPFEDIQFQLVDLPPIGNESTDGWVSSILRNADVFMLVVDLSDDPEIQSELLLDQLASWRIPLAAGAAPSPETEWIRPKPVVLVGTKCDLSGAGGRFVQLQRTCGSGFMAVTVSTRTGEGLGDLRRAVFGCSGVIRVYSKEPGKKTKQERPFTLSEGATVLALAEIIHKDFVAKLKHACVWGSVRFDGQKVERDYVLRDGDVVELRLR